MFHSEVDFLPFPENASDTQTSTIRVAESLVACINTIFMWGVTALKFLKRDSVLNFFSQVSKATFYAEKSFQMKFIRFCSLHWNHESPKKAKSATKSKLRFSKNQ